MIIHDPNINNLISTFNKYTVQTRVCLDQKSFKKKLNDLLTEIRFIFEHNYQVQHRRKLLDADREGKDPKEPVAHPPNLLERYQGAKEAEYL